MLKKSYTKNYLKTYFWSGASVLLNLASLFLVVPRLTSSPTVYGIYAICVSVAVYLSYADIGFLKSGIKYAAEYYAQGNIKTEQKYVGFSIFVLSIFVLLIGTVFVFLSQNPFLLIKGIKEGQEVQIASSLLLIQALFSVNVILQRFIDAVFQIRVESFVPQRIRIVGSIIKIGSIFYFFSTGKYDIIGYFLLMKSVDFLTHVASLFSIKKRYHYNFKFQLRCLHFDRDIFSHVKGLAFSSLYVTFAFILYYEMDQIVIGKWIGADAVAIYAVAFTLFTYFRTIISIIFAPFQQRFNHFVGLGKTDQLREFVLKIIKLTMPIVLLSVTAVMVLSGPFIIAWVGNDYSESAIVATFLMGANIFIFINNPASYILTALVRIKELYFISTLMVVVYWLGIFLTINTLGIQSMAIFKAIVSVIAMLFYLKVIMEFLKTTLRKFLNDTIGKFIVPLIVHVVLLLFLKTMLPLEKSIINLLSVLAAGGMSVLFSILVYYFISKEFKGHLDLFFGKLFKKPLNR